MQLRFLWRALRARYRDNRTELQAIRGLISPSDVVCDIGANKGSYLYWLSKWAQEVVAFEPQPELASYLKDICQRLGMDNVTVEQTGVAARTELRKLYLPSPNSPGATLTTKLQGTAAESISVQVVTLDEYFANRRKPTLLKIDVEGAELDVFKGADRLLTETRPAILFECEQHHLDEGTVSDVLSYLQQRGYDGEFIRGNERLPVEDFNTSEHQEQFAGPFWKHPGYCNNFIFSPVA